MAIRPNRTWDDAAEGTVVPRIELDFPYTRVVWGAVASMDMFPGHHEAAYAQSQGQKTIYVNTMVYQAFIDRVVTDWAGPGAFIIKRKMTMQRPVYGGDRMYGEGVVTRRYRDDRGRALADIDVDVGNAEGVCCPAKVTVMLDVAPRSLS
ncbi:MaoC/PaaZ C-terminal domain-containing protein [Sphingopyxis granuli]|uniref:MaoC/PaaZ C-terminal domain-containing protein n=1 Tax=Sphingopyxis granuli TaxID=267128 RepID=UPI000834FD95|nr:MaoC/PaaZ C-terminal domain-containing protein [Sphingopyxis granuli]